MPAPEGERCPEGAEGASFAAILTIPGHGKALSPTACGRSPLPEGAKKARYGVIMAKLYFRYGAMNSGKTTALMQVAYNYKERGMRVLILKPAIDTKGQDSIISRLGISCKVDQLVTPEMDVVELVRANEAAHGKIACVLCDESQFFTPEQADQLFLVTVDLGIPVICYGLRADFMMRGFPGSTRLLEIAHTIEELKTICACGRKAICNGRKVNGEFVFEGAQVAIDTVDDVEYQSLCPQCWYREYRAFLARHPKK